MQILFDKEEPDIRDYCRYTWNLQDDEIGQLLGDVHFQDGYASFSLQAIEKLLPFMEEGMPMTAPPDSPAPFKLQAISSRIKWFPTNRNSCPTPSNYEPSCAPGTLPSSQIDQCHSSGIWHTGSHSHRTGQGDQRHKNYAGSDFSARCAERECERDNAAQEIRSKGVKPTRDAIDRYLLWEEQGYECVYSGRRDSPDSVVRR